MQPVVLDICRVRTDTPAAGRFRHRLAPADEPLVESIRRDGLLCPVLVLAGGAGEYDLVSGFRRVEACRRCGAPRVAARVAAAGTDPVALLDAAVRENLATGGLSEAERLLALARYVQLGAGPQWILDHAAPMLGFAPRPQVLHRATEWAAQPPAVHEAVGRGELQWSQARLLAELAPADAAAALALLRAVRLTHQEGRAAIEAIGALAAAENRTFAEVVADVVESARSGGAEHREAGARLIEALDRKRCPARAAARDRLDAAMAALRPPADVQVRADRTLEDDRIAVTIRAADADAMRRLAEQLAREAGSPRWRAVFDALATKGEHSDA
jgi:ParB family chromosome partitioning protein